MKRKDERKRVFVVCTIRVNCLSIMCEKSMRWVHFTLHIFFGDVTWGCEKNTLDYTQFFPSLSLSRGIDNRDLSWMIRV